MMKLSSDELDKRIETILVIFDVVINKLLMNLFEINWVSFILIDWSENNVQIEYFINRNLSNEDDRFEFDFVVLLDNCKVKQFE